MSAAVVITRTDHTPDQLRALATVLHTTGCEFLKPAKFGCKPRRSWIFRRRQRIW
jgi:hypothetical protein